MHRAVPSIERDRHELRFTPEIAEPQAQRDARYTCTASWFDDGRLGELFLGNHRADSHADACAKDAAILASLALQFGVPMEILRKALLRDSNGRASTPIGTALDLIAAESAS